MVAGWAEQGRVKVERAKRPDLEAVLRSEQVGLEGAEGGWSPPGGARGAKRTGRGATGRNGRVAPEPNVGGGGVGEAEPGQGGKGAMRPNLEAVFREERVGRRGRVGLASKVRQMGRETPRSGTKRRRSAIPATRPPAISAVQNTWQPEFIR